ncbi:MAG: hypothetical protein RJB34_1387 [Pseudomonadota bacterium]|jgi:glycosyltransferase involved in cell wall biosynthesis
MNIIHLVNSVEVAYGGTGLAAQRLSEAMAGSVDDSDNVFLYVVKQSESMDSTWNRQEGSGLNWVFIQSRRIFGQFFEIKNHISMIQDKSTLILHLHGVWSPLWLMLALWFLFKKYAYCISTHGSLEPWALNHKKIKKSVALILYQKWILNFANLVWVTSNQELNNLRLLKIKAPIVILPNGVDDDLLKLDISLDRRDSLISKRQLLFMSRIHPVKGLFMLAEAWAILKPNGWRVVLAGSDECGHTQEIKNRLKDLGIQDDFLWVGMLSRKAKYQALAESNLFILPSHSENFGIVIAEALAAGLPVITTKGTPWASLIEADCGWWCDVNTKALALAMADALTKTPHELHAMGLRGRALVASNFSWTRLAFDAKLAYRWALCAKVAMPSSTAVPSIIHID